MSDSLLERAAAGVRASLAAIVGDGGVSFWYTPDAVLRAPEFYGGCLPADPAKNVVYTISPGRVDRSVWTNYETRAEQYLTIVCAHRFPALERPFAPPTPQRETVMHRMAQDVERKLCADNTQLAGYVDTTNGQVFDTAITAWEFSAEQTYIEGWALAFGRLLIDSRYPRLTP